MNASRKANTNGTILTAAFYKFVRLEDYRDLRQPIFDACTKCGVLGTVLLASEGINGILAGPTDAVHAMLDELREDPRLTDLEHKEAYAVTPPFLRLKVRLKKEIVSMGVPGVDPSRRAGTYVKPQDWNALIEQPGVVVIDARNEYEVALGTFRRAINPHTSSFRELPGWLRQRPELQEKPRVAMFCTGGIRCEKSTAFLREQGFDEVFHLQGGILKYLEAVPAEESQFVGECFVFDERVSVGPNLAPGRYDLCRACRRPIDAAAKSSALFVEGVSCSACHDRTTTAQKERLAERQKQMALAGARDQVHLGAKLPPPKAPGGSS